MFCDSVVQEYNTRKINSSESMKERPELKANKRDVNNIVLKANTSISGFQGLQQHWGWQHDMNRTSKDTGPWKIESWGLNCIPIHTRTSKVLAHL